MDSFLTSARLFIQDGGSPTSSPGVPFVMRWKYRDPSRSPSLTKRIAASGNEIGGSSARGYRQNTSSLHLKDRMQQEYNNLLVNALNRIFKSNLSLNNFKWLLTKLELSCVRNIIPRSRKRLWNGYPVLNEELQNHDPVGRHIPVQVT